MGLRSCREGILSFTEFWRKEGSVINKKNKEIIKEIKVEKYKWAWVVGKKIFDHRFSFLFFKVSLINNKSRKIEVREQGLGKTYKLK